MRRSIWESTSCRSRRSCRAPHGLHAASFHRRQSRRAGIGSIPDLPMTAEYRVPRPEDSPPAAPTSAPSRRLRSRPRSGPGCSRGCETPGRPRGCQGDTQRRESQTRSPEPAPREDGVVPWQGPGPATRDPRQPPLRRCGSADGIRTVPPQHRDHLRYGRSTRACADSQPLRDSGSAGS